MWRLEVSNKLLRTSLSACGIFGKETEQYLFQWEQSMLAV
jgi:hypothetical protein